MLKFCDYIDKFVFVVFVAAIYFIMDVLGNGKDICSW